MSEHRPITQLEIIERQLLAKKNMQIPYEHSLTATVQAKEYIKNLGKILDYSSIVDDHSYLMTAFIRKDKTLEAQVEYLAKSTKNMGHLLKEEGDGKLLKVKKII